MYQINASEKFTNVWKLPFISEKKNYILVDKISIKNYRLLFFARRLAEEFVNGRLAKTYFPRNGLAPRASDIRFNILPCYYYY